MANELIASVNYRNSTFPLRDKEKRIVGNGNYKSSRRQAWYSITINDCHFYEKQAGMTGLWLIKNTELSLIIV